MLLAALAAAALAAAGIIDTDRVLDPCGFRQEYRLPCPACGMTGATLELFRGRPLLALSIQPAVVLLWLAAAVTVVFALPAAVFGVGFRVLTDAASGLGPGRLAAGVGIILAAGWVYTLLLALSGGG